MFVAGLYYVIRAFRGNEFYLTGIGGAQVKPVPRCMGRLLMALLGIAAMVLSIGVWFQQ